MTLVSYLRWRDLNIFTYDTERVTEHEGGLKALNIETAVKSHNYVLTKSFGESWATKIIWGKNKCDSLYGGAVVTPAVETGSTDTQQRFACCVFFPL